MAQETIKFTIKQDGTVTEEVIGVQGSTCENVTRKIEERLGVLNLRELKPEYYLNQPVTTEDHVSLRQHKD